LKSTAKYSATIVACGQHPHRDAEVDDHRAIFWVVETGGTPLSLTFVREGQFVADGNGLMGTQVAKPSRGTVLKYDCPRCRSSITRPESRRLPAQRPKCEWSVPSL